MMIKRASKRGPFDFKYSGPGLRLQYKKKKWPSTTCMFARRFPSSKGWLPGRVGPGRRRLGMPALALTDHNRLTGAIEFYDACLEAGVQPILGLEADILPSAELAAYSSPGASPLVLLASEPEGWASLCRLSSLLQGDPAGANPARVPGLADDCSGLLCLTGGRAGCSTG